MLKTNAITYKIQYFTRGLKGITLFYVNLYPQSDTLLEKWGSLVHFLVTLILCLLINQYIFQSQKQGVNFDQIICTLTYMAK